MNSDARNGIVFYFTSLLLALLFVFSLLNATPSNPLDAYKFTILQKIFPQGWGFFSKAPQDEVMKIYNTDLHSATDWPNNSMNNLFGINRKGRTQGIELGLLYTQVAAQPWKSCNEKMGQCLKRDEKSAAVKLENITPKPNLCGDYFIVSQKPVPWAWADLIQPEDMPSKYIKVHVLCTKQTRN
ncbi:SdpA family antimicrobial peptide system protein [Paenibacillus glufosinatiresistens]|uniref:SdpA family antimicrobial peptide system protein n=1 Tax=Paenibacillus glufosinatiresistens TaxID=3070657 RepID=UPI00286DF0D2|nr:SdpA family antimicrobial peptide system protein [Paenibacillus sp. YX.27]